MNGFRILLFILVLVFIGSNQPLFCQTGATERLTIESAVLLSLRHNPDLETARLDVAKAHAQVKEAWGYTMPSIDLSSQYSRAIKKPIFFLPGTFIGQPDKDVVALEVGSTHSLSFGVTATQLLFNGTVFAGVGASTIYSEAAEELYRGKKAETVAKTKKAFYAVLLAKEALSMMQSSVHNAEENLANVRLLRSQGVLSEYDELRAEVGVENVRPLLIQSETNYSLSIIGLSNTIGIALPESTLVEGELKFQPYDEGILERGHQTLVEANPNLNALRLQKEVNNAFVTAARSDYLPTLAAFGNYQYQGQKNTFNFSSSNLIASSTVGLQLSVNLFQGLQTNAKVEEAKIEVMKTETQVSNTENTLLAGFRSLVGTLHQAQKRVEAQTKTVETAERGYKIVTARFLANAATQLDVNDAQLALTQAKVNRIQAIFDYLVAAADIDNLLGRMPEYASIDQ